MEFQSHRKTQSLIQATNWVTSKIIKSIVKKKYLYTGEQF